jgi:transcriptional regulator with XRE-family HTH domain
MAADQKTLYAQVGKNVRRVREKRGLTQGALASLVGLTRTSVTNIERGKQKLLLHTLVDLAHVLDVSPAELLGEVSGTGEEANGWQDLLKDRPRIEQQWIKSAIDTSRKGQ